MEPPSRSPRFAFSNETTHRIPVSLIRAAASACLGAHGKSGDIEFAFVDDERIRALNREHRGIDEATDVLTFSAPDFPGAPLGEVVISVPYARRQSQLRRVSLRTELAYLAIHGVLHLCGFEDENAADRHRMLQEMARIGTTVGLPEDREWSSIAHEVAA